MTKLDAIFFAAHPDDAELSAGGTIIKLAKSRRKIGIVDLTQGEMGTRGSRKLREQEAKRAGKILGLTERENLKIPDGNIENNSENRLKVITVIRKYKPKIIFFPHFHDRHPDHHNAHVLIKDSAFYAGLSKIVTPGFTSHRPNRNFYYMQTYVFKPNIIIDISDTFATKMKSVACYSTQFYSSKRTKTKEPETFISNKKFIEYISARAKFYGFQIGAEYGEPFFTEEDLKINADNLFNI